MREFVGEFIIGFVFLLSTVSKILGCKDRIEFSVLEELPSGSHVGYLPNNESRKYSTHFIDLSDENDLQVSSNGSIFSKSLLDRERKSVYNFVVSSSGSYQTCVRVSVMDVNDNAPRFRELKALVQLQEKSSSREPFFTSYATDKDSGDFGVHRYEIYSEHGDLFNLTTFQTDRGQLMFSLFLSGVLDYSKASLQNVVIRAYDGGVPAKFGQLNLTVEVVKIVDWEPVFVQTWYSALVAEDALIGTSVAQVQLIANDEEIEYIADISESNDFEVDSLTGIIRVKRKLDFELQNSYVITVNARVKESSIQLPACFVSIQVLNVFDDPPAISFQSMSQDENNLPDSFEKPLIEPVGHVMLSSTEENINESIIVNMKSKFFDLIQQTENDYWVVPKKFVTLDQRYYNLSIEARYSNHLQLSSVKNVSVAVNSFRSSSNQVDFSQTIYFAKIKDIVQIGTPVIQVRIEGEDKNYIFKFFKRHK